jgi:hypothetical protein
MTLCIASTDSISGVPAKLDAAGLAEPIEELQFLAAHDRVDLIDRSVRLCVQIDDALATFFRRSEHRF